VGTGWGLHSDGVNLRIHGWKKKHCTALDQGWMVACVMYCTESSVRMLYYKNPPLKSYMLHHKQYCRCVVTGRSGRAVQRGRASRFFLISSEMRMRVFSSLRRTEKPGIG
jgi:hypothetical protein